MTVHGLADERARPWPPRAAVRRNGLVQLGWPHFWLLAGVLGGTLALVALVFFISIATR
jgi:hypothetical protein